MVQAGDAVTRDTLLISGVVESKTGPLLRRSSGRVIAETSRTLTAEVPLEETLLLPPRANSIFRPVFTPLRHPRPALHRRRHSQGSRT